MEIKVTMTAVFLAVLIIGTTLSVILTVALTSRSVGENTPERKVLYFAMYLGDDEGKKTPSRSTRSIFQADNGSKQCSLELNKNNTISSIRDMKNSGQLYSFILYTTSAESTPPRKTDDAITELGSIKAKPEEKKFKQLAAVDEFLAKKKADDVLVFYIPCNVTKKELEITTIIEDYELSQTDEDTKEFVEKLASIQATTMLVSNTMNSSEVVKVYKISKDNVVGKGEEVAEKIKHFAETASATTVTAVTVTGGTTESVIETTSAAVTTTALPANMTASTLTKLVRTTTSEASTSTEPTEATTSEVPDTASTSGPITTVSTLATTATEEIPPTTSVFEETTTEIAETSTSTVAASSTEAATTATTSEAAETSTEIANSTSAVMNSSSTVPPTSSTTEDVIRSTTATESPTPASSSPSTTVLTSTTAETSTIMESSTLLSTVTTKAPPTNSSTSISTTESPTSSTTTAEATTTTEPGTTSVETTSQSTPPPTSTSTETTTTMKFNTTSLATTSQATSSSTSASTEATTTEEPTTTSLATTSQAVSSSTSASTEATSTMESNTTSVATTSQAISSSTSASTEATSTMESNTTSVATTSQAVSSSTSASTEATSTTESNTTSVATTSQAVSSSTSASTETTSTMKSNTTSVATTSQAISSSTSASTVSSPPQPKKDVHCLFVFDLYNFGKNQTKYEQEKYLVGNMSEYFFSSTDVDKSGARLWKYGYNDSILPAILNDKESKDYFNENLKNTTVEETDDPLNTSDAIAQINRMVRDRDTRVNSLIFISAQQNTSNLPQFEQKNCWKKVIAVGFNDTDLSKVVEKVEGEAVSIRYNFNVLLDTSASALDKFREEQLSSFGNPEIYL